MVSSKLLNNSPLIVLDVTNAHTVFGPDLSGVRGKIVIHKKDRVKTYLTQIPRDFYDIHKFVNLTVDVMFVNQIALLTNFSRKIRFYLVNTYLPSRLLI